MSKDFLWRYRPAPGKPLGEPVKVTLTDKEAKLMRDLSRKADEAVGAERTALLNEITTIMDIRACFPDAQISLYLDSADLLK
jgi:hypothetical protein